MISVLCMFIIVKAQETSGQNGVDTLHPNVEAVLVVLSILFCITFLIVAYAKFCHRLELHQVQGPGGIVRSRSRFSGIDRRAVESLPFFRFSSLRGSKQGLECAVCLSRFEDTEFLRLLPRCRHAFHMNCIDKWLENHSSCPLCRYRFNPGDLKSLTDTTEEPNLEFYIEREQYQERSSRFDVVSTFQMITRGKREEPLIGEFGKNFLHSFRHKIIVSDVMSKSRWSDVNSSDLLSLNSQMLDVLTSKRFSTLSGRFACDLSDKEQILNIKEDIESKRLQVATTSCCNDLDNELELMSMSKSFDPSQKRSMSEITNVSRFKEFTMITGSSVSASIEKDDNVRRLWLSMARRTLEKFRC